MPAARNSGVARQHGHRMAGDLLEDVRSRVRSTGLFRIAEPMGTNWAFEAIRSDEVAWPILEHAASLESAVELSNPQTALVRYVRAGSDKTGAGSRLPMCVWRKTAKAAIGLPLPLAELRRPDRAFAATGQAWSPSASWAPACGKAAALGTKNLNRWGDWGTVSTSVRYWRELPSARISATVNP